MAEMKEVDKLVATAMKTLEQSCQAGDGESCYDYGRFLLRGDPAKGVNPDVKKAAKVLRTGCDFEHAKSCQVLCSLNQVYLLTRNYKIADIDNPYLAQFVDFERVREWKRKSFSWTIRKKVQPICQKADQLMDDLCLKGNDDEVCSRQGSKYMMQDNHSLSKAEALLKHGCFRLKDPNSCLSLSHLYSFSNQMFTNPLNSATYLRIACEAPFDEKDKRKQSGAAEACLLLAKRKEVDYLRSEDMSDRTELLKHQYHYFRRGCDLLNARSCIGLGLLFLRIPGHSVASTTIDGLNASPYNTRNTSAVINEPLSSTVAHNLSPSEIQEREIGAIRSFQSACNNCGEKLGCYLAGLMLSTDRGLSEKDKKGDTPESLEIIRENLEDARDYLQLACDKGEQLACQNLDPTVSRLETTITKLYRMLDKDADARKPW